MGQAITPQPVMLFVGMLTGEVSLMDKVSGILQDSFGPLLHQSEDLPWNYTGYYSEELGQKVLRRFLFFSNLVDPGRIAQIKIATNEIEWEYSRPGKEKPLRHINLDPGYIDAPKVVLATTKDYAHRIYLGEGIYAEMTLSFVKGGFQPLDHTYPDYRSEETIALFNRMREELLRGAVGNERGRG
jgi:hypothetical protein